MMVWNWKRVAVLLAHDVACYAKAALQEWAIEDQNGRIAKIVARRTNAERMKAPRQRKDLN